MFVRAGVYRVVKEAMGGMAAKLAVSALLFDYVLTGPISGVSAGRYVAGLVNDLLMRGGSSFHLHEGLTAIVVAIAITLYFWWRNTRGLHESSERRAEDPEDHDRHGRHPHPLVPADAAAEGRQHAAAADTREPASSPSTRSGG